MEKDLQNSSMGRSQLLCLQSHSFLNAPRLMEALFQGSSLRNVIVGCNSYVGDGCSISDTVILGNDTYTNETSRTASRKKGEVVLGIGEALHLL